MDPLHIERRLIAPCGMNCALCLAFQRPTRKCPGCREEDTHKPKSRELCVIRNCTIIQNTPSHFCYECERMPCKRLTLLDSRYRTKYGMSMIANLREIKEQGMAVFLAHQAETYRCPTCGELRCVHRSRCLRCSSGISQK